MKKIMEFFKRVFPIRHHVVPEEQLHTPAQQSDAGQYKPPSQILKRGDEVRITNTNLVKQNESFMKSNPNAKPLNEGWVHVINEDSISVRFEIPSDHGRIRFESREYPKNEVELVNT